jgi:DNA-binding transcriptional MerR regulator
MPETAINPGAEQIPDKLYFRIGEVSRLTGVKPYVLRFWETEFGGLGPRKTGSGHRLYRRKDVELILEIKHLLYERRFTIEGARKLLESRKQDPRGGSGNGQGPRREVQGELFTSAVSLDQIRTELKEILEILK